jgi:hypothetical protein
MSTAVYVYSVPADRLRAIPGFNDKQLLDYVSELEGFFETIDEIRADFDEEEEQPPECEQAYRQIVKGQPYTEAFGYVYGYAYEAICMAIGTETEPSWTQIARSYDWFKDIDRALAELKIKLKVTDLLYRGPLIDIPRPDDFPALGWWTADEVAEAARVFQSFDLSKVGKKTAKKVKPVADAIEDIRSWITVAAGRAGEWLIGVHS